MSKGRWQVFSQIINGERMFISGRQLDTGQPLHGGNVEYFGEYHFNEKIAQQNTDSLNREEEQQKKGE